MASVELHTLVVAREDGPAVLQTWRTVGGDVSLQEPEQSLRLSGLDGRVMHIGCTRIDLGERDLKFADVAAEIRQQPMAYQRLGGVVGSPHRLVPMCSLGLGCRLHAIPEE